MKAFSKFIGVIVSLIGTGIIVFEDFRGIEGQYSDHPIFSNNFFLAIGLGMIILGCGLHIMLNKRVG